MTVLIIRAHTRFGVCRGVKLRSARQRAVDGLLIEVSRDGCRISNIDSESFAMDDLVEVEIEGRKSMSGRVRWHHGGMIGLRLVQPLHTRELANLVRHCRGEQELAEAKRA